MIKVLLVVVCVALLQACSEAPPPAANNNSAPAPTAAPSAPMAKASPLTEFETDLQYIRNGQYTYVWVFARKDGKKLDKDDGAFLRTNAPQVVDWVTTDDERKVIAGTNFNLEEGNMAALQKRFVVENYSGK